MSAAPGTATATSSRFGSFALMLTASILAAAIVATLTIDLGPRVREYAEARLKKINEAYERMLKSDVKYRFVIDMGTI